MNYGLPYKGSKNRIAKKILEILPPAPVLYDVFCGGCAITHAALLSGKYSRVVANDINGMIPHAFETAMKGGFGNEDRWISREEFRRLYLSDPYVAMCFSFANNLKSYCYASDLEPYKRALHYAIFWKDIAPWAELCPETADALGAAMQAEDNRHKRRIKAGRVIVSALKQGLSDGSISAAVLDKPIYRKIRKKNLNTLQTGWALKRIQSIKNLERMESGERLDRINNLGNLETLQSMESLDRMCELPPLNAGPVLTVTTGDYRALNFEPGGIIYCDPPYKSTEERYGRDFDFAGFYSWCEHQANPVFISEYTMPEDRFVPVAAFSVTRKMDTKKSSICHEKIWRPICQLD